MFAVGAGKHVGGRRLRCGEAMRVAGAAMLLALFAEARAQEPQAEVFTGLEASNNALSGYLGAGYAFGKGLYEPGWRVRSVGGLGRYDYQGTLFGAGADLATTFNGEGGFAAALIGYPFRAQRLVLRLFAGVEGEDQRISPHDPGNRVQGTAIGLKLQAESWLDLWPALFVSVDGSYGTAFQEYWSLARFDYRLGPRFSLGLEGGALGNEEYAVGRGGGFVRANLHDVEITVSDGFTGNYLEDDPSGYLSLGIYRAF
jgi:hypothetical protein